MKRREALSRPSIRSGVIACWKLSPVTLKTTAAKLTRMKLATKNGIGSGLRRERNEQRGRAEQERRADDRLADAERAPTRRPATMAPSSQPTFPIPNTIPTTAADRSSSRTA